MTSEEIICEVKIILADYCREKINSLDKMTALMRMLENGEDTPVLEYLKEIVKNEERCAGFMVKASQVLTSVGDNFH